MAQSRLILAESGSIEDTKGLFQTLGAAFGSDKLAGIVETSFNFYLECLSGFQKESKERLFYLELEAWMETLGKLGELVLEDHSGQEVHYCVLQEKSNSNVLLEPDIQQSKQLFSIDCQVQIVPFSPKRAFDKIVFRAPNSLLLTSGNMKPFASFEQEFGVEFLIQKSINHVIDSKLQVREM